MKSCDNCKAKPVCSIKFGVETELFAAKSAYDFVKVSTHVFQTIGVNCVYHTHEDVE